MAVRRLPSSSPPAIVATQLIAVAWVIPAGDSGRIASRDVGCCYDAAGVLFRLAMLDLHNFSGGVNE